MEPFLPHPVAYDPASVAGKQPPITEETDILIIGAGIAGCAAALAAMAGAADSSVRVMLVEEGPVPLETMGEEVPLHFGGRMGAALTNRNAVFETMLDVRPELGEALEAGVDVRLGTAAWGIFPQQPTAAWIDGMVVGVADEARTYLIRARQVIVAAGRRDMGLAFDGWERPGVMGASAAYRLATTYDALDAKVAVLVGSDTAALQIGKTLSDKGVRIAAIIERRDTVTGDADLLADLTARGARVLTGHVIRQAEGDVYGVTAVVATAIDADGRHVPDQHTVFACDTVLLGIAAIPAIELIEAAGCAMQFQPERGGHAAVIDAAQRTSLPAILVAGDCAGTWATKTRDDDIARKEGRVAASQALLAVQVLRASTDDAAAAAAAAAVAGATALSASDMPSSLPLAASPAERTAADNLANERAAWVRASVVQAHGTPFVCQCEEVTAAEILQVKPPRYLAWAPRDEKTDTRGVAAMACDGPPNPDIVKRLTRACMGACQGRRCREQVAALLAIGSGTALERIPLATFRSPVRPLALTQLATLEQAPALEEHWDSWFGMASQWVPFWRAEAHYTAAGREQGGGPVASE